MKFFGLCVLFGIIAAPYFLLMPPESGAVSVTIPQGATRAQVAEILVDRGVIRSKIAFLWFGRNREVRPGYYAFTSGVYPWYAVRVLEKGPPPPPDVLVTIPEGKRLVEIAAILQDSGIVDASEFLALATSPIVAKELVGSYASTLEGYLFPDSYKWKPKTDARKVIERMHRRFLEQIEGLSRPGMTRHEFITLASIVEKEAKVSEERPRIAAVYLNRLRLGMRLEADPTVRYAINKWDTVPVLYADLESTSPYNTYRTPGLPPGPIASVGRASLEAVARPLETKELFFVAREDGSHVFAENFSGHRANIARYRR